MSSLKYLKSQVNGRTTVSLFADVMVGTFDDTHPNFDALVEALDNQADIDEIKSLLNPINRAYERLRAVSDRVELNSTTLLFDGRPVDTRLSRAIVSRFNSGDASWRALVAFMERLALNPSSLSRIHLFAWIERRHLTLCDDGCFIAYKGVNADGTSVNAGPGIVDGVAMWGHLPNEVGSIVEIDRDLVDSDRDHGCSVGLHVGTFGYASAFADRLLTCKVDPADVVSVPRDCDFQKIRVARYQVLALAPAREYAEDLWDDDQE